MEHDKNHDGHQRNHGKGHGRRKSATKEEIKLNAVFLTEEKKWIERIIEARMYELTDDDVAPCDIDDLDPPLMPQGNLWYAQLVEQYELSTAERVMMMTALLPHIAAEVFTNRLKKKNSLYAFAYTEFGGIIEQSTKAFLPTLQTALFLLGGRRESARMIHRIDFYNSQLLKEQILQIRPASAIENEGNHFAQLLMMAPEYVNYLICGEKPRIDFGDSFPASLIDTDVNWDKLIVREGTRKQIDEVLAWVNVAEQLNKTVGIKTGFPCLFYGPPGTGKTLAATLIGKHTGKDVFRIDLSMIVSKYVGETEKNLAYLFERAQNKDCILFFDEADSLFSKRTGVSNANDKWANLEVSYLLQRMETYPGLTILASNLKDNIDTAMTRRFQAVIYFGRPKAEERVQLWKSALPEGFEYHPNLDFEKIAKHDMTGANIANIIKYCCTQTLNRGNKRIELNDMLTGLTREYTKESRTPG